MNFSIYRILKKLFTTLVVVVFIFPGAQAFAQNTNPAPVQHYVIKLNNGLNQGVLDTAATNIRHLFPNNSSRVFANIFSFDSASSLASLKSALAGKFVYLEADRQLHSDDIQTSNLIVTNDPGFTNDSKDVDKEWALPKAGFDEAWTKTVGSSKNVVAVIDTGVDATHEDLQSVNWADGFNFIARQPIVGKMNSDDNGHGTLVSGILGASANNGMGIVGTNWQITLMPLKVLDASGKGDASAVSEGIVWAADHGAQFINLSVGGIGFGHDTTLANAIAYAFNKNTIIIAAAGNDVATTGGNLDQEPVYPICDDNNLNMVLGVTAVDQNDLKPAFANFGRNCIDVAAPGRRILSTINFDPLTKKYSPNSYAYASGTSLAVPFVVGQAALIKALHPSATNVQIRDRIISTVDVIDDLNLSQCNSSSCRGLLGAGRINVPKSLATAITAAVKEGDLVKTSDTNIIYLISGGQKRPVSTFVLNQRFSGVVPINVTSNELASFPDGPYATPTDGTLVKWDGLGTVYYITNGMKQPVTFSVFQQRSLSFANVQSVSFTELNSWPTGNFLPPVEGTLLRTVKNKTVYWVVSGVLHPINYGFYIDKGLNVFPVLTIPDSDINGFAKGDAYVR